MVQPKYPIGTDPEAMDRLIEHEIERRFGQGRRPEAPQARDRGKIFNDKLMRAMGRPLPGQAPARATKVTLTNEDGDVLEEVKDGEMPEILPHEGERFDE